jgi:hypothetical protein
MTDFIAELEAELVAAARRRATRRRVSWPRLVPAIAAVAAIALLAIVVSRVGDPRPAGERPAPPPADSVIVELPPAAPPVTDLPCTRDRRWKTAAPPLAIFARPRAAGDDVPLGTDWLPTAYADRNAARRTGLGAVWLVPVAGVGPPCAPASDTPAPGACLVDGNTPPMAHCFPYADIAAGRAIMSVRAGRVAGIAPDGVQSVQVNGAFVPVRDNAYEAELPGVEAGDEVRVELVPAVRCEPSQAAYGAVPALVEGAQREPPRALEDAMAGLGSRGAWRAHARVVVGRYGVNVWVVPDMPCDRYTGGDERVCLWVAHGSLTCDTPAALRRRGVSINFRRGNVVTAAGIAPAGARHADVAFGDLIYPFRVRDGVFGALIVKRIDEPVRIAFR